MSNYSSIFMASLKNNPEKQVLADCNFKQAAILADEGERLDCASGYFFNNKYTAEDAIVGNFGVNILAVTYE